MFVQVLQGRTSDAAAVRAALDRYGDLAPAAAGFLGATAGVTEDGRFIGLLRFESADAAQENADRREQQDWWGELTHLLDGAVVHDATEVDVDLVGDPDAAGFVQVMQGRTTDPEQARALMSGGSEKWAAFRPDILGSVNADHGDRTWTTFLYFTSEAEAREGERKEPPPELQAQMAQMATLADGPVEYFDLTEPWLYGPR